MAPGEASLAEVLERIEGDARLSATRRRDVASALRSLGRILALPLTAIPANPMWLRARLRRFHPQQAGISRKRWQNIRSDLGFALSQAGIVERHSYLAPLSDDWSALFGLVTEERLRWNLSRLAHYGSAQGIAPDEIDDQVLEAFHIALIRESLIADPDQVLRSTINAWNRAAETVAGWPEIRLTPPPSRRETYALPWSRFPASLEAGVEAWLAVLGGEDILGDEGPGRPLRPATLAHRAWQVQCFASALVYRGVEPAELAGLADLVTVPRYKEGLRFFLERNGGKASEAIYGIAVTMKQLAKHHVRVEPAQLAELTRICNRVRVKQRGLTESNRERLRQFDDPAKVALLLELPERLLRRARQRPRDRKAALMVQMALAVELLLMAPLRRRNLAGLHTERHLQRTRSSRHGVLHLVIPAGETKNREPLEFELPPHLADLIREYLDHYRPLLLDGPNDWLFPGRRGRHKIAHALSTQIRRAVFQATGLEVNVHLFRHIGAKLYLDSNPGAYEVVRRTLAHSSIDTTTAHYTGFETKAATRHFDAAILSLRAELKRPTAGVRGQPARRRRQGGDDARRS
jgi:integrase